MADRPLTEKQFLAIEYLCSDPPINTAEVARRVGVDRKTIYRWMNNELFKKELEQRHNTIKRSVQNQFIARLPQVIEMLFECMKSKDERVKLQAINSWLERALGKSITPIAELSRPMTEQEEVDLQAALDTVRKELKKSATVIEKAVNEGTTTTLDGDAKQA